MAMVEDLKVPDPERYSVDFLVDKFWEDFRPQGRHYQSLREDAALFLDSWKGAAGKENVTSAYHRIMEREEEDLELGGKPHRNDNLLDWLMGRWQPPEEKRGGLRVYG